MERRGFVYIMANARNGTIYLGVISDLPRRVWEHRTDAVPGFTREYGCHMLVWYETYDDVQEARQRELRMKDWRRAGRFARSRE